MTITDIDVQSLRQPEEDFCPRLGRISPLAHPRSRDHRHPVVVHESSNLCAALRKAYRKRLGSPRKIFSWLTLQIIRPVSMSTTSSGARQFVPNSLTARNTGKKKKENGLGRQSLGLHTIKSHVGTHQSLHKLSMQTHTHHL